MNGNRETDGEERGMAAPDRSGSCLLREPAPDRSGSCLLREQQQYFDQLKIDNFNLARRVAHLEERLADAQAFYYEAFQAETADQNFDLQRQLNAVVSKAQEFDHLIRHLQESNRGLQECNRELQESNHELQESKRKLDKSNRKLQDSKHELEESNHELQESNRELQDSKRKLQDSKHELEESNFKLEEINPLLQESNRLLLLEVNRRGHELAAAREGNIAKQELLNQLQESNQLLALEVNRLERELKGASEGKRAAQELLKQLAQTKAMIHDTSKRMARCAMLPRSACAVHGKSMSPLRRVEAELTEIEEQVKAYQDE